jgi:hypothetical protein
MVSLTVYKFGLRESRDEGKEHKIIKRKNGKLK